MAEVKFESHLSYVQSATEKQLAKAAEIIGGMAESYAKKSCPKDTGNLQNSITHNFEKNVIMVGTNVTYAPYVELGTGVHASGGGGRQTSWRYQDRKGNWHTTNGMPARPYLRPSIENHISEYKAVLEDVLKGG
jgi:phage gpG-like protein